MSADQGLPITGAPTIIVGVIGAAILGVGALFVTAAQWGARLRGRTQGR